MKKYVVLLFVGMVVSFGVTAQTLKFKLSWEGDQFVGKMSPKWFKEVSVKPKGERTDLLGAAGSMTGGDYPQLNFLIAENALGTDDALMLKTKNGWYPISNLSVTDTKLSFTFPWDFQVSPTSTDVAILKKANELLADEEHWEQEDDRDCESDLKEETYSLYCALKHASGLETGDFNHRGAAMEVVRKNIALLQPTKKFEHQLMEFNNAQSFQEIKDVLFISQNQLVEQVGEN